MKLDKDTLQSQLDRLAADEQAIRSGLAQRNESIQKLQVEIDQNRGALSYNLLLAENLRKQLKELAEQAT